MTLHRGLILLLKLLLCMLTGIAAGAEFVTEGSATIVANDLGQARELAIRRALAQAAEQKEAQISTHSLLNANSLSDEIQVRASACTSDAEQVSEHINGNTITVVMHGVVLAGASCLPSCRGAYMNRVLVTAFAMEFPEQLQLAEISPLAQLTAVELSRKIRQHKRLLPDFDDTAFPYRSAARAPEPYLAPGSIETIFTTLARNARAQYVLSGIYRDFGLSHNGWGWPQRQIEIEAFVHDGVNGAVLVRHSFAATASGAVSLKTTPAIGSSDFYRGDLGKTWGGLLEEIATWADAYVQCLPFSARVLKIGDGLMHIDAGAESGLSAGDTLNVQTLKEPPVRGLDGQFLGQEKRIKARARVRTVYPKFSIVEITESSPGLDIKTGDVLYTQ